MYVKLFSKILDSSIWLERDSTLRVWITLLVSMDSDGFCAFASIENLARRANVYPHLVRDAIAILESPDPKSSGDGNEGRRIEKIQGGWVVLNAQKYRDIHRSGDLRKARKPLQLPTPADASPRFPAVHYLTTNGINESLPEVEVEADIITTAKRKRKKFTFEGFHSDTAEVVNHFLPIWPISRGNGSEIQISKPMFAHRISELLHQGIPKSQLIEAGDMYLAEKPDWAACPQYFFGPGNGKSANFASYMNMIVYQQSKVSQ